MKRYQEAIILIVLGTVALLFVHKQTAAPDRATLVQAAHDCGAAANQVIPKISNDPDKCKKLESLLIEGNAVFSNAPEREIPERLERLRKLRQEIDALAPPSGAP